MAKGPFTGEYAMIVWKCRVAVPGKMRLASGCARYVEDLELIVRMIAQHAHANAVSSVSRKLTALEVDFPKVFAFEADLDLRVSRLTPFRTALLILSKLGTDPRKPRPWSRLVNNQSEQHLRDDNASRIVPCRL